jgi:hypothetical protein
MNTPVKASTGVLVLELLEMGKIEAGYEVTGFIHPTASFIGLNEVMRNLRGRFAELHRHVFEAYKCLERPPSILGQTCLLGDSKGLM